MVAQARALSRSCAGHFASSTTTAGDRPPLPPPGRDRHALAFTIDYADDRGRTVTVRDRDTLAQERIPLAGVAAWLGDRLA